MSNQKTGNDSVTIKYPSYWDTLDPYFGDMKSNGSVAYGENDDEFMYVSDKGWKKFMKSDELYEHIWNNKGWIHWLFLEIF